MTATNDSGFGTIAPLQNVSLVAKALEKVMNRREHLPGIIAFYGFSGLGKTMSAIFSANKYRAYYVEAKEYWTRKALLEAILQEMGITPEKTISKMADQVAQELAMSRKPLIIDEFDHIVKRNLVEMVRSIYEGSQGSVLIIGEERIPKLIAEQSERFHGRVLSWVQAQEPDLADAKLIRKQYITDVSIKDDVLKAILESVNGSVRRIATNLEKVREFALEQGLSEISMKEWQGNEFDVGQAPRRRR